MNSHIREYRDLRNFDSPAFETVAEPLENNGPVAAEHETESAAGTVDAPCGDDAATTADSRRKTVLASRYEPARRVNIGCGDQVVRALDRNKLRFEDSNPFTTLIFIPERLRGNHAALMPVIGTVRQWQLLGHPHIVQTQELVQDKQHSFLTAEHLQGCSLERRYVEQMVPPLTPAERLKIINDIGSALSYAHAHDMVHGQLSPVAVWLAPAGPAKLLDAGVCSLLQPDSASDSSPARRAFAPAAYQSAEAAAKSGGAHDRRTDVYALACIGYELLTGQHPFDGLNAFDAHLRKANVRQLPPLTHRQWSAFKHALQFQASDRTPSIQRFLDELNAPATPKWLPMTAVAASLMTLWFGLDHLYRKPQPTTAASLARQTEKRVSAARLAVPKAKPAPRSQPLASSAAPPAAQKPVFRPAPALDVFADDPFADEPAADNPEEQAILNTLLERGNTQLAAGQYTEPQGASALDTYREIVRRAPDTEDAKPGIRALSAYLVAEAQKALAEKDLDSAEIAARRAQSIDPTANELLQVLKQISAQHKLSSLAQERILDEE